MAYRRVLFDPGHGLEFRCRVNCPADDMRGCQVDLLIVPSSGFEIQPNNIRQMQILLLVPNTNHIRDVPEMVVVVVVAGVRHVTALN